MNHMIPENATISKVERSVKTSPPRDRYGAAYLETVYSNVRCRLDRTQRIFRATDGTTYTLDGTVIVQPRYKFRPEDLLTIDREVWRVFSVDDSLDIQGNPIFRTYNVVRQKGYGN